MADDISAEHRSNGPGPRQKPWSGDGREELAAAVRRLMTTIVTSSASPDVLAQAAAKAAALADELDRHVQEPSAVPMPRYEAHEAQPGQVTTLASAMPFDMVIGTCNPVAPPIAVEFDPPKAIGRVDFSAQYEGAPGCVHGAVLAGAFDIMLTAANFLTGAAGPTVELSIRYRKPTLISHTAVFEAWVTGTKGRRIYSQGHLIQDGVVTVEATGEFARMERSRIEALHTTQRRPNRPGAQKNPD